MLMTEENVSPIGVVVETTGDTAKVMYLNGSDMIEDAVLTVRKQLTELCHPFVLNGNEINQVIFLRRICQCVTLINDVSALDAIAQDDE